MNELLLHDTRDFDGTAAASGATSQVWSWDFVADQTENGSSLAVFAFSLRLTNTPSNELTVMLSPPDQRLPSRRLPAVFGNDLREIPPDHARSDFLGVRPRHFPNIRRELACHAWWVAV